ncbi:MAG: GNAT family N-acetyltransferase [Nonomuraea sp.]|nr:GNAT family N-acetyltransferase [Nonomuraea sp.]
MSTPPVIRTAGPGEAEAVASLIALAFLPLEASKYLVPDAAHRHAVLAGQFVILTEHAIGLDTGQVDVIDGADGGPVAAAVWFDQSAGPMPPPADYDARLAWAAGHYLDRFVHLDKVMEDHHPEQGHHFLLFLAVHPDLQGRGLGSALLEHHHGTALGGQPAYLDAASPQSRDLYARHGYQGGPPYDIAGDARFWPMWRPA